MFYVLKEFWMGNWKSPNLRKECFLSKEDISKKLLCLKHYRQNKQYNYADSLRKKLAEMGYFYQPPKPQEFKHIRRQCPLGTIKHKMVLRIHQNSEISLEGFVCVNVDRNYDMKINLRTRKNSILEIPRSEQLGTLIRQEKFVY